MKDTVLVRRAAVHDLEAVYAICLKTGDGGRDATGQYRDPEPIGHVYAGPYLVLDGLISFVAEDENGVLGYAVGAADTRTHELNLELDWWPSLRKRYPEPSGERDTWTRDEYWMWTLHHPATVPDAIVRSYPAHIHMNLLQRARGRGIGSRLLDVWLDHARKESVSAVHAGVSAANEAGLTFWTARGFQPVGTEPSRGSSGTVWCGRRL